MYILFREWECELCPAKVTDLSVHMKVRHRRRIKTEEKTKVVASVQGGGEEFIQCLFALAVLPMTILSNRMNSPFLSNQPGAIHPIIQNALDK